MARRLAVVLLLGPVLLAGRAACAQQVTLANTRGLDFGRFAAGGGGTVTVAPGGLRSRTGGVVLLNSPSAGAAAFTVSLSGSAGGGKGGANKAVVISMPANGSIRLTSGAASMAVDAFTMSPDPLLAIPAGGTVLSVGATLGVAPNQAAGSYAGSFPLIVNYQ
jgi:hypothetical protein